MAWEQLERGNGPGGFSRPKQWRECPCVKINKTGMTINKSFVEAFMGDSSHVLIFIDQVNRRIGFKVAEGGESNAYRLSTIHAKKKKGSGSKHIGKDTFGKKFPDCVGYIFRAHLNPGERVIEVDLSPENRVKWTP